jgi:hypothetical protein
MTPVQVQHNPALVGINKDTHNWWSVYPGSPLNGSWPRRDWVDWVVIEARCGNYSTYLLIYVRAGLGQDYS